MKNIQSHKSIVLRERMLRDNPSWRPEVKQKLREHRLGKPLTKETKLKLSLKLKGRKFSKTHKQKISKALKNRTFTSEWKKKISENKKGKNDFYYGRLKPIIYCTICGTMKVVKPSRIRYYKNFLCTKECKSEFFSKEWLKPKHNQRLRENRAKQILPTYDTKPEKSMQNLLSETNIKFIKQKVIEHEQTHWTHIDLFIEPNICIFVDGCYFHYCIKCNKKQPDKRQIQRLLIDRKITDNLTRLGYQVIHIWSHDILSKEQQVNKNIINLIKQALKRAV